MKISKFNLFHLSTILLLFLNLLLCGLLNKLLKKSNNNEVMLYGHDLTGNLLSIYSNSNYKYITINYFKYRKMKNDNRINLALSPRVMLGLLNSKVIIVSHGMFFLNIFRKFSTAKIVNVWHGLPNQLIDEEIFNQFDENWFYSDFQKALFKNPQKLDLKKVRITGYGRLDALKILEEESPPRNILIANTWTRDLRAEKRESFSISNIDFIRELHKISIDLDCHFFIKPHINFKVDKNIVKFINHQTKIRIIHDEISTEELINLCDVLFTDWSSILFDFLYTKKPAYIFKKNIPFSGEPNPIFKDIEKLRISEYSEIEEILSPPYNNDFKIKHSDFDNKIFRKDLINKATQNYLSNIRRLIKS